MKKQINKILHFVGLELHGTGYIKRLKSNASEKDVFQDQKNLLSIENPVIFDVGANRGDISIKYNDLFKNAKIFSFEPFYETFEILERTTSPFENITSVQKAVSDTSQRLQFFSNANPDTNSLLKPEITGTRVDLQTKNVGVVEVQSITIDSFCEENHIPIIDLLKLDIQGGELKALQGAERMLKGNRIKMIYSEVFFNPYYENQPLFQEISTLLYDHNFYIYDIYNLHYLPDRISQGDAIFLSKNS